MANEWHRQETYRSLIQISVEGFKLLVILNGGAALALLAYLTNTKSTHPPDLHASMVWYVVGLTSCAVAVVFSYLTQFGLFNQEENRPLKPHYMVWFVASAVFVVLSMVAFMVGSLCAVSRF